MNWDGRITRKELKASIKTGFFYAFYCINNCKSLHSIVSLL